MDKNQNETPSQAKTASPLILMFRIEFDNARGVRVEINW